MSNKIGAGGTKPDNSWKIEASKNFTIDGLYNKGPYMVVNKSDLLNSREKSIMKKYILDNLPTIWVIAVFVLGMSKQIQL